MGIRKRGSVLALGAAMALGAGFGAAATDEAAEVREYHVDGPAMGRAATQASAALLREDVEVARKALRTLQDSAGRMQPEEGDLFGTGSRTFDRALHKVLSTTRESLAGGETGRAFDEFVWVQRTCRECHAVARERGLLPADGPLWKVTPPPDNHAKSTHSPGQDP